MPHTFYICEASTSYMRRRFDRKHPKSCLLWRPRDPAELNVLSTFFHRIPKHLEWNFELRRSVSRVPMNAVALPSFDNSSDKHEALPIIPENVYKALCRCSWRYLKLNSNVIRRIAYHSFLGLCPQSSGHCLRGNPELFASCSQQTTCSRWFHSKVSRQYITTDILNSHLHIPPSTTVVNGSLPGPLVSANKGDSLSVCLKQNSPNLL